MLAEISFAFAGNPGSGKSTAADYLHRRHGFKVFEGSEIIRAAAQADGVQVADRASYDTYYRERQRRDGYGWLAEIILNSGEKRVANAGLRNRVDASIFKANGVIIVAMACPLEQCFDRIDRTNPKNKPTYEAFAQMEAEQQSTDEYLGSHTEWVLENADICIDSSRPVSDVERALDQIVDYYAGQQM